MDKLEIRIATSKDSSVVKKWINKMYGSVYETRTLGEIGVAIKNKQEYYTLAFSNENIIGFAGASKNKEYLDVAPNTVAVIDYIYVKETNRDLKTAYALIKAILKILINNGHNQAILQVQTFNKQRFLHYALSDKNIIKSFPCSYREGYEEQILLIKDLVGVYNQPLTTLLKKCKQYME